jgi:carbamoyltransferase
MILGLSFGYHDSAAVLLDEKEIIFADNEERYSRIKFDPSFPKSVLREMSNNYDLNQVTKIAYYEKPIPKLERQLVSLISGGLRHTNSFMQNSANLRKHFDSTSRRISQLVQDATKLDFTNVPVLYSTHHLSHASSAYFTSKYDSATVIVMDAVGEWNSTSVWEGKENHLENIWAQRFPHSIGLFYSAMTQFLGFKVNSGEYKLMGLAPYGLPIYLDKFREVVKINNNGTLELNLKFFDFVAGSKMVNGKFETHFGMKARSPQMAITQWHADMAATTQKILEDYVFNLIKAVNAKSISNKLCLSGGVALNCVLNGKLAEEFGPENVHIFPASGDAGGAAGAALAVSMSTRSDSLTTRYDIGTGAIGRLFSKKEIRETLENETIMYHEMSEEAVVVAAAEIISKGGIVGIFSGRSEFGPRALGNRSILADPRVKMGQIHINQKIKFRESFRPFAPICLEAEQDKWFLSRHKSNFMLRTVQVKSFETKDHSKIESTPNPNKPINISERLESISSKIPSVTHLDGSARIQTVESSDSRLSAEILNVFFQSTGCPVLINTSFNVRGEPIVGTPMDAIRCFSTTELDALVFDNFLILKSEQSNFLSLRYPSALGDD